jgi:hypothetical protein
MINLMLLFLAVAVAVHGSQKLEESDSLIGNIVLYVVITALAVLAAIV